MKNQTLVSVVMPTYIGEKTIKRAIDSVLNQTYQDFEFIIINDGSQDNTNKIVSDINDERIIYLKNDKNLGIQKSLNKGLNLSKGKYIARIDDDDKWSNRNKLKEQVNFLQSNEDYVLVGTNAIVVNERGEEILKTNNTLKDHDIRKIILGKNFFLHSSVVFRKEVALRVGGYDEGEETLHIEDYDLWLKIGRIGKFANLPIYGLYYVKSKNQISSKNQTKQLKGYLKLIRKYKKYYPGYYRALLRSCFRIFLYGWLNFTKIKYRSKKNEF